MMGKVLCCSRPILQIRKDLPGFFQLYERLDVNGRRGSYSIDVADGFSFAACWQAWLGPFYRDMYGTAPFPFRSCPPQQYEMQ